MDSATSLVRWYLHVNGYFTITDYPVFELMDAGEVRTLTDIDIMAVRLPNARRIVPSRRGDRELTSHPSVPDPALALEEDHIDMIIGEIKEGKIELNRGARDPSVLRTVLMRFGAIDPDECDELVAALLDDGHAVAVTGPRIRLMCFGTYRSRTSGGGYEVITLKHVLQYLESVMQEYWPAIRYAQLKDPAANFLAMMEKARSARK